MLSLYLYIKKQTQQGRLIDTFVFILFVQHRNISVVFNLIHYNSFVSVQCIKLECVKSCSVNFGSSSRPQNNFILVVYCLNPLFPPLSLDQFM